MPRSRLLAAALLSCAIFIGGVQTASSTVPTTRLADVTQALLPSQLAPPACNGMLFSGVTFGDGDLAAVTPQRLFLGGPGDQHVFGTTGNDCIIGGDGADILDGDGGNDVCIGSATATFISCEVALTW